MKKFQNIEIYLYYLKLLNSTDEMIEEYWETKERLKKDLKNINNKAEA